MLIVCLDLTLKRAGFQPARDLMALGIKGDIQLMTTPSVLHIVGYYTSKQYGSAKTKQVLLTLLNDIQVIDCDHTTSLIAINSAIDDIEDALQYYAALRFGADYFISADKKLKRAGIPQLPVYNTTELLEELK